VRTRIIVAAAEATMQVLEEVLETASRVDAQSLERLAQGLPQEWIKASLEQSGVASLRRRRLPAEQVIWLVIGMALMRGRSIDDIATKLEIARPSTTGREVARSALVQARQRVGAAPLKWLFQKVAAWACERASQYRWRGLSVLAMDGSHLCVADSEPNATHFGRHRSGKHATESAYPMLRIVWLLDVHARLVRAAAFGPYGNSELGYARTLIASIPEDSVVIMDRLYHGSPTLLPIVSGANRHFVVRAKSNAVWRVVESLGPADDLVEVTVTDEARAADPTLPKTYLARAVQTRTPKNEYTLLTSLLDPQRYPGDEIRALYRERWEVEIAYDELKTEVLDQEPTLRSRSVAGVEQELWGTLLAYNLVRMEMAAAAREANVPPRRISFVMALRLICDEWLWDSDAKPGTIPKHLRRLRADLQRFVLPPRRSERSYPRVVKRKESPYPRKRSVSLKNLPN
jgi:hypothetical protein